MAYHGNRSNNCLFSEKKKKFIERVKGDGFYLKYEDLDSLKDYNFIVSKDRGKRMFFKEIRKTEHYKTYHEKAVPWSRIVEIILTTKNKRKKERK